MMKKFKQHGGTFLGIILGVMVGLAVALGVAIYVAKVPVPFLNKGASRTSSQDAAETEKNKDWDPNAPLRGRAVPLPTTPSASAATPAEPVAPAVVARPVASAPARSPSNDPLGDFVAARSGAQSQASAAAAAGDPFAYFVQAGAFRTPEDAEAQRARLSLMDVQASVSEREQAGRTVYRVRVGPFQNRDAADRVKQRLDGEGFEAALVRVQR